MPRWPGYGHKEKPNRARSRKRRRQPRRTLSDLYCRETTGGQGVHREVESEGLEEKYRAVIEGATPMMNRSAKDGARSSWHYGSEGVLTHPSYQGVCGRHGTEDLDVTPGGLVAFPVGTGISNPISRQAKWEVTRGESSDSRIVPQAW